MTHTVLMLVPVPCLRVSVLHPRVGVDLPSLTQICLRDNSFAFGPEKEGIENTFIMRSE